MDTKTLERDKRVLDAVIAFDVAHGGAQQSLINLADLVGGFETRKKMAYDDIDYINGVVPALKRIRGYLDLFSDDRETSHQDVNRE